MRRVLLTASSLIVLGTLGWACDNDPTVLPTGAATGTGGSGGDPTTNTGGNTSTNNGGNGATGNEGGGGNGTGGQGGAVEITTCVEDLAPQEAPANIVISEVSVGNYIEVYNPTNETKDLAGAEYTGWRFCAKPSYPLFQSTTAGISLPPGAYRTLPWPNVAVGDNANGELAIYVDTAYATPGSMVDYVCWGDPAQINGGDNRKGVAQNAGEWAGLDAPCAQSLQNGVLRRINTTSGDATAAWDHTATADPTNCDP